MKTPEKPLEIYRDDTNCFGARLNELEALRNCLFQKYEQALNSNSTLLNCLKHREGEWTNAIPRELFDTTNQPLAMAVSPLADVDVLDEGSSTRNQASFALSLAGLLQKAGLQAQASAFEQFAKRLEQDAHTRTALPVVNSYGDGGIFGWEIGPRFRAMKDPGVQGSGVPANILDRQTFPALIIVGFNQEDVSPRLGIEINNVTVGKRNKRDHEKEHEHAEEEEEEQAAVTTKIVVLEPYLAFHTVPRWLRLKDGWWGRLWQKRYAETELLKISASVASATKAHLEGLRSAYPNTAGLADYRLRALKFNVFGTDTGQLFDPQQVTPLAGASPAVPTITGVFPNNIQMERDDHGNPKALAGVPFAIVGNNLKGANVISPIGGAKNLQVSKAANNNVILFTADVTTNDPIVFGLSATLTNSSGTVTTNYIFPTNVVRITFLKDANAPVPLVQTVQTLGTNGVTEYSVKIAPHLDLKALKAATSVVINEINKAKPQENANVSVQVQAEQKNDKSAAKP